MNFEEVIIKYVEKAGGAIEQAINVAMEEVPIVIQEYIQWRLFEATLDVIVAIIFGIVAVRIALLLPKLSEMAKSESDERGVIGLMLGAIFVILSSIFVPINMYSDVKTIIQINVAPRVFLIDEAYKFYNSKNR